MQSLRHKSSNPLKYRPDIDGLRALAVLSVIGFHASSSLVPGGYVGVDIFFVISGFLITSIICRNLENDEFSFIDFYARRARRIFPALIVVLLAALLAGWMVLLRDEFQPLRIGARPVVSYFPSGNTSVEECNDTGEDIIAIYR